AKEAAVRRIGRVLGDAGEAQRPAVVPGGVTATVGNRDWMLARRLVEIFPRERTIELRVVEHEAVDPHLGRGHLRFATDGRLNLAHRAQIRVDAEQLLDAARMRMR